jgi:hypothetical protein
MIGFCGALSSGCLCGENDDAVVVSVNVRQNRRIVCDLLFKAKRKIQACIIIVRAVKILDLCNRNVLRRE